MSESTTKIGCDGDDRINEVLVVKINVRSPFIAGLLIEKVCRDNDAYGDAVVFGLRRDTMVAMQLNNCEADGDRKVDTSGSFEAVPSRATPMWRDLFDSDDQMHAHASPVVMVWAAELDVVERRARAYADRISANVGHSVSVGVVNIGGPRNGLPFAITAP